MPYAMRSDGLILNERLRKYQCLNCGVLLGKNNQFSKPYLRSSGNSVFDEKRHYAVAVGISELLSKLNLRIEANVLEIGGANFATSIELKKLHPRFNISNIEQSPERIPQNAEINIVIENFLDYFFDKKFDVIFSNNVLEHIDDTRYFLKHASEQLSQDGYIVVCCPTFSPVSNELLFTDHLYHFTPRGLDICCQSVGLQLLEHKVSNWDQLTQTYLISKKSNKKINNFSIDTLELYKRRKAHIEKWSKQDKLLQSLIKNHTTLLLFGAGEFSQLIRTYLPKSYAKVNSLVVESLSGSRIFDKPIIELKKINASNKQIIVGVNPASQEIVKIKLIEAGFNKSDILILDV